MAAKATFSTARLYTKSAERMGLERQEIEGTRGLPAVACSFDHWMQTDMRWSCCDAGAIRPNVAPYAMNPQDEQQMHQLELRLARLLHQPGARVRRFDDPIHALQQAMNPAHRRDIAVVSAMDEFVFAVAACDQIEPILEASNEQLEEKTWAESVRVEQLSHAWSSFFSRRSHSR